ncbi:transglutaminase family protein [Terrihabitans sp. B22-R8]|uniref:transglutaminase family protein n=1 Tax=Terrihabitans sp. B22-R8 TaxID=3425128 RepID=UPI00403C03BB
MRIRITHDTTYRYAPAARSAIQVLRLTPRDHEGQFVADWDVRTEGDASLARREDCYGNITHVLSVGGPLEEICLRATGVVDTEDQAGIVRGAAERFPPGLFLRQTRLTETTSSIRDFAETAVSGEVENLARLHALTAALYDHLRFDVHATDVLTTADEAFTAGHGVCQDFAHVFLAGARSLQIPARYVSGYLYKPGEEEQEASHAWVEAYVPELGWVSFDPTNGISATESYVRMAVGLDYLDCAPIKGSYQGLSTESMSVTLKIESARRRRS